MNLVFQRIVGKTFLNTTVSVLIGAEAHGHSFLRPFPRQERSSPSDAEIRAQEGNLLLFAVFFLPMASNCLLCISASNQISHHLIGSGSAIRFSSNCEQMWDGVRG